MFYTRLCSLMKSILKWTHSKVNDVLGFNFECYLSVFVQRVNCLDSLPWRSHLGIKSFSLSGGVP